MRKQVPRDALALVARRLLEPEAVRGDFPNGAPATEKDPVVLGTVEDQPPAHPRGRHVVLLGIEQRRGAGGGDASPAQSSADDEELIREAILEERAMKAEPGRTGLLCYAVGRLQPLGHHP